MSPGSATASSKSITGSVVTRVTTYANPPYCGCANRTWPNRIPHLDRGTRAHALAVHGLVCGDAAERARVLGHWLAHRHSRQACLLHRPRDADPRSATRSG